MERVPVDYLAIVLAFLSLESFALRRNWTRWKRNEYNHQFEHNIGIGNLQEVRVNSVHIVLEDVVIKSVTSRPN